MPDKQMECGETENESERVERTGDGRIDAAAEERYWRSRFSARPYVIIGSSYDEYGPAYRYGWEAFRRHRGKTFEQVESDLRQAWDGVKGKSKLVWSLAKHAVRDAWDRVARHE
ncbi:MAG TPA: hypothetical protein VL992_16775 [Tepidisphaeraceae bacterium]|nr:hypothetical protein [Tepidisphaeraceae bacterium]